MREQAHNQALNESAGFRREKTPVFPMRENLKFVLLAKKLKKHDKFTEIHTKTEVKIDGISPVLCTKHKRQCFTTSLNNKKRQATCSGVLFVQI